MQVLQASQALAEAAHALIVAGMAHELIRRASNLHDAPSVSVTLARSGFGPVSIRALGCRAATLARQIKAASTKEH
jgi:hypothetical protein